jgi:hypothetical protein
VRRAKSRTTSSYIMAVAFRSATPNMAAPVSFSRWLAGACERLEPNDQLPRPLEITVANL